MYERMVGPAVSDLYAAQRATIAELVGAAGPGVDAVGVPACPAWDVADLTAHLAGTTAALVGRDYPGDDVAGWIAAQVAARRGRTAAENLAEWDAVGGDFDAMLARNEEAWGALLYDAVAHEHDLRDALGRPGGRTGAAVDYALDRTLWQLDKRARETGLGTLVADLAGGEMVVGDGEPSVVLRGVDRWELFRALGSRRTAAQLRSLPFTGDPAAWIAQLPYDLPAEPLVHG